MATAKKKRITKKGSKPLILVSNDDGISARGIRALIKKLKPLGRVVAVAPDQERSAASHSITLHRPLRVKKVGRDLYSVDGTPTDCVMIGMHEVLGEMPDLIVSGINHGANLGDDVHYSGTVSAAFEGGIFGIPSIAVSLVSEDGGDMGAAADFAAKLAKKVLRDGLPKGIILNVNVPPVPAKSIKGYEITKQGKRDYGDVIVEKVDPKGRKYYWIGGDETNFEDITDSDCNAIRAGKISITPLRVNLTDRGFLKKLKSWKL
jgi:5'/3'-nucleotidase